MSKKTTIAKISAIALGSMLVLTSCESSADKASYNLSVAADQFEVQRSIIGINGITDEVMFEVEGRCSIERDGDLIVTCKHGPDDYRKHFVGLGDNANWVSTQLDGIDVSEYRTRVVIKPENIIPDFDVITD